MNTVSCIIRQIKTNEVLNIQWYTWDRSQLFINKSLFYLLKLYFVFFCCIVGWEVVKYNEGKILAFSSIFQIDILTGKKGKPCRWKLYYIPIINSFQFRFYLFFYKFIPKTSSKFQLIQPCTPVPHHHFIKIKNILARNINWLVFRIMKQF